MRKIYDKSENLPEKRNALLRYEKYLERLRTEGVPDKVVELAGFPFDFRVRRDFPKKVTKPFLLVDLLDNVEQTEDGTPLREAVLPRLSDYDSNELKLLKKIIG